MSDSVGRNLIVHQNLLRAAVKDNQSSFCSGISVNSSVQVQAQARKSSMSTKFWGKHLIAPRENWPMGLYRLNYIHPHAVLATDSTEKLDGKFNLDENIELQVDVNPPTAGSASQLNFQVTNGGSPLILHWGAIQDRKKNWFLPSHHPNGTIIYKNRALRTPFVKSGDKSFLRIDIGDPSIKAVEFLIFDEAHNKWFKNNGENFHVDLLRQDRENAISMVPDDLVQIQAYLRWERKGKQMYTPQQEKSEFEEARKELQAELDEGTSLDEIRKKLTTGGLKTKDSKQLRDKRRSFVDRIQRKKRDLRQIINKYASEPIEESFESEQKTLTELELFAKKKEELEMGSVLNKKNFKLSNMELLVLVTGFSDKMKVHLAANFQEPLTLHWALSNNGGDWLAPPPSQLPPGSVSIGNAIDTPFSHTSSVDPPYQLQLVEIDLKEDAYVGMPFVLFSNGKWIKNNGSDFYVEFSVGLNQAQKEPSDGKATAKALLDKIAEMESEAQKSFMHRFNIAADLTEQAKGYGVLGFAGILVWMRFMATRQLTWNKNYNVKPREISKAQDRLTDSLQSTYIADPRYRELLRMIMSTIGRGGEGDVGQRIRDEILVLQRNNDCKGGMMEEWHQKLHNNTSPDDVVICQALIDYIKNDFDVGAYWKTLTANGITKERLLSYDRGIHSEPNFRRDQKDGLLRDLGNYLRTLKAVHSGSDLEAAISNCLGYRSEGKGFMVGVQINPVSGLPSGFPELLNFVLYHIEDRNVEALLEGLLEAREELRPLLFKSNDRLKDLVFLDTALDSTVRTAIERGYEELNNAGPEVIMKFITLILENLALSSDDNEDFIYCLKGWGHSSEMIKNKDDQWALYAKSVLDRTRLALANKAEWYQKILQPSAVYLGSRLGVNQSAVNMFTEEIIRAGSAASLSLLVNRLDPVLRMTAHLGSWQVISPVEATGYVVVLDELLSIQNETYERPTILIAKHVKGEEEIPDGTVAVLTPDMPDVLSHVSVRARNGKICFATCFDSKILVELQGHEGKLLHIKPTSADIVFREVKGGEQTITSSIRMKEDEPPRINLVKKRFGGRYAISSVEFTNETVGAKSRNIAYLKGKVPSWIGIPSSVALPFGVFEKVLSDNQNKSVAGKLQSLKKKLWGGDTSVLGQIRDTVLELAPPPQLAQELENKMKSSGMPWPGDEGDLRWEQAWMAIKKVWASKWNERAYLSMKKVKLDHDYLCMAVLVQEIINADYAFVIHTTNPSSGDESEIYAEVVKGLGETLVGAYPGRAMSFVCKKNDLDNPKVLGYPSKPVALFIRRSIIFRSDSNGEDLEGYAGAGLYDSVAMDEEEKVVVDYSSDPLIMDGGFRRSVLSAVAGAGNCIEELYGCPQDIEGVVRDGKIYVVQSRPQM